MNIFGLGHVDCRIVSQSSYFVRKSFVFDDTQLFEEIQFARLTNILLIISTTI